MYVYIIHHRETSMIKIGLSDDPMSRLKEIQTGNGNALTLRYVLACPSRESASSIERLLHKRYGRYRATGEWFKVPCETVISDIEWCLSMVDHLVGEPIDDNPVARIDDSDGQVFTAACPDCDWKNAYSSERAATNALTAHRRHHHPELQSANGRR